MCSVQSIDYAEQELILQNCLAKALYDNDAESPEELGFKKGDVLTVLEQNPNGLQGWWLCALRGRQGIAPGNRLRLMPYMYDPTGLGFATGIVAQNVQCQESIASTLPNRGSSASRKSNQSGSPSGARIVLPPYNKQEDIFVYDTPQVNLKSEYDIPAVATLPRLPTRETPLLQTFAVPQSQNYDDPKVGGQYDIPRGVRDQFKSLSLSEGQYDFPSVGSKAAAHSSEYDIPAARSAVAPLKAACLYDKPPHHHQQADSLAKEKNMTYDVPASTTKARGSVHSQGSSSGVTGSLSSLNTSLSSGGGSNRSSLEQQTDDAYDIPQKGQTDTCDHPRNVAAIKKTSNNNGSIGVYDIPPQVMRDRLPYTRPAASTGVQLELHSALETLVIHQQEVLAARQLVLASSEGLRDCRSNMRVPSHTLLNTMTAFYNYSQGAVQNAIANSPDQKVVAKLHRLLQNLGTSLNLIAESCASMDAVSWTQQKQGERDELDRLLACARSLTDDVQQISFCIQTNASYIFKQTAPIEDKRRSSLPTAAPDSNAFADNGEYDYIQMQSESPKVDLGPDYESLMKKSQEMIADKSKVVEVPPHVHNDQMLREYYSPRLNESITYLGEAIDSFLSTIEKNQPPRVFVEHTKFVLIAAHRVACIGDTLHRHLSDYIESDKFRRCSEKISTSLRLLVDTTKRAALHFPAAVAIQEMVDTVMGVSHLCHALKGCFVVNTGQLQKQQQQLQQQKPATPTATIAVTTTTTAAAAAGAADTVGVAN